MKEFPEEEILSTPDAEATPSEIIDPTTGEVIDRSNIDSMVNAYERVEAKCRELYTAKRQLAYAMYDQTQGSDAKTRRIEGENRKAKIERPDDAWDQSILKEIWNSFPKLCNQYLRIEQIGVKLVPYKQLMNTTGTEDIEQVKKMLKRANRGPMGTPRIKIER